MVDRACELPPVRNDGNDRHAEWSSSGESNASGLPGSFRAAIRAWNSPAGTNWILDCGTRDLSLRHESLSAPWSLEFVGYGARSPFSSREGPTIRSLGRGRIERTWDPRLTEWYVLLPTGVEHGFTLSEPVGHTAGEPLRLDLSYPSTY